MKRTGWLAFSAVALLSLLVWSSSARAQTRDHLKCYRAEDASEAVVAADLDSVPFGVDAGCTIAARVREHCVPASADVIASDAQQTDFQGDELASERLCYEIKCPKRDLPAMQVTDRFGSRVVSARRSKLLCLPAVADAAP